MAFVPFASWNSRSITHLANYLSRSLPMNSSDESPCQRPANQYAEQLRERRGPPKHAEIRVRRSFNGTESGTEFPGRCLYALCEARGLDFSIHKDERQIAAKCQHDGEG